VWDERLIDAVLSKYVHKGDELFVEGQIENRKYTDSSGVERWVTEIVLKSFNSKVVLLSGGKKGAPANDARGGDPEVTSGKGKPKVDDFEPDSDIPF
jgi:single-strand DNA-binding protein